MTSVPAQTRFHEMFSIVINPGSGERAALERTLESLAGQSYRNFEIILAGPAPDAGLGNFSSARGLFREPVLNIAELSRPDASLWRGDYLMLMDAGDTFSRDALEMINRAIHADPGAAWPDLVIFDHKLLRDGETRHLPGWDPDLLQHHDYILRACAIRRGAFEKLSGSPFNLAGILAELANTAIHVTHVRQTLMELDARKAPVRPLNMPNSRAPAVSIIIPNRTGMDLLPQCTAFLTQMQSPFQLIIVDNDSDDPAIWPIYKRLEAEHHAKILRFNAPFNYSAMMNMGVRAARHELLLFLNNDVVIRDARHVAVALDYAARPDVGVVGSLLRYPNGRVQHAGMVMRPWADGGAHCVHVLRDEGHDEKGQIGALSAPRNWQSVTGAFNVLRKAAFLAAGQFDEASLPIEYNDVDLCLRMRMRGLKVICLPLEGITHAECQTRRHMDAAIAGPINLAAMHEMNARWPKEFGFDPYDHPALRPAPIARLQATSARKGAIISARLKKLPAKIARRVRRFAAARLQVAQASPPQRERPRLLLKPGLSIVGYLNSEIGLGEAARQLSFACDDARVPTGLVAIPLDGRSNEPAFRTLCQPMADRRVSLVISGMDQAENLMSLGGEGRVRIAYPFWELPDVPAKLRPGLGKLAEIWAPSRFIAAALEGAVPRPVRLIRQPVQLPACPPTRKPRGEKFHFFTFFDFDSHIHRKNPMGVITAFKAAFAERKDVELFIKARGMKNKPARRLLARAAADDPRIHILDATLSREQMDGLMTQADAFVSLHRSEGFGFGAAEALAKGKAVIATDWGGTTDFITETTGYPIACKLRPLLPGEYVLAEGQHWAEPSLEAAVAAMRRVAENPDEGHAKALAGYRLLSHRHSHAAVGAEIARALAELGA